MQSSSSFSSVLSYHLENFLQEKHNCGFDYSAGLYHLKQLDKYWLEHNYQKEYLTAETLSEWCEMKDTEGPGGLKNRLVVTREFSNYLCGLGYSSFIPRIETKWEPQRRRPLLQEEIGELFQRIDNLQPHDNASDANVRIINEYPIIFRFLYLLGMRIGETCSLPLNQYDADQGVITILNGKGNKDRLVYLPEDLKNLCREYICYLRHILCEEPVWLFPGRDPTKHINKGCVNDTFNYCWNSTTFASLYSVKPVVHDLRHTMVVHKINIWASQGLSFEEMRPYISAFLGHKTFSETLYYFHYTKEGSDVIHSLDKTAKKVIAKVRRI